jgi:hypothetical protein
MSGGVTQLAFDLDKRWRDRDQRWVAPGKLFNKATHAVDVIDSDALAKRFIGQHHYAGTYPAARLAVGLYGARAQLVGLAVFSVPASNAALAKWTGMGHDSACELGRFACTPDVAYNGETWFLARAMKQLAREKGIRAFVSFADPVEWHLGSAVVKPQHWGTIYQASNAMFVGRSDARTHLVAPNGRPISPRALSKLSSMTKGWEYAERQLLDVGAPPRLFGEHSREWLARVRVAPGFTRARHPGNLAYVFGLDDGARRSLRTLHGDPIPFPKRRAA